jgi:uncharacterized protein (TIGR02270 family)
MTAASAGIIPFVIAQHAEDAAFLHGVRTALARGAHVKLKELATFDMRLAAQLDALAIAGEAGWPFCDAALESPSSGAVFMGTVRAIEDGHEPRLIRLLALAESLRSVACGLSSAFGWVSQPRLQGTVLQLLRAQEPFRRRIGLTACAMHRVDCGLVAGPWIHDTDPEVRARALRAVGETGLECLMPALDDALQDEDGDCRFWAARSTVVLGSSAEALDRLARTALEPGAHQGRALRLALQAMARSDAHSFVRDLARDASNLRSVIQGSGIIGDPSYVPWLINQTANPPTARLAAESFSLITGVDIRAVELHADRPDDFEAGPNDNPDDANVDMDPDDGLPWPDKEKIEKWWAQNAGHFQNGARYFMGAPVTRPHCIDVLKNGYQRQRILAAHYLCLLEPGTPLFNTSAPAWRQQRWLAKMG